VSLGLGTWVFLNKTRAGLVLRAVGENHDAAHSLESGKTPFNIAHDRL
jgi:simple sugar transport system permease protein